MVRGLARDPLFELENHSFDHVAWEGPCYGLPQVRSPAAKRRELTAARKTIERVAHVTSRYFRFPGGCHAGADVRLVDRLHERAVQWDVISGEAYQPNRNVIVRAILAGAHPGAIIVAHCIGAPNTPATAAAMAIVIRRLRAEGYHFVTLRRLLGGRPKEGSTPRP